MSTKGSTRARRFLHQFILGDEQPETLRWEALPKCCNRPHPDDLDTFREFFASSIQLNLKTRALDGLGRCPVDHVRPVLREILTDSEDAKLIAGAALALVSGYILADEIDRAAAAEDTALFESLARREILPDVTRSHIQGYVTKIREKQELLSAQPEKR